MSYVSVHVFEAVILISYSFFLFTCNFGKQLLPQMLRQWGALRPLKQAVSLKQTCATVYKWAICWVSYCSKALRGHFSKIKYIF